MKPQYGRDLSSVSKGRQLDYSSPPRGPIGSKRTRTRAGSNVTMLPFSKASTSCDRFASSVRASDFRLPATLAAKLDNRRLSRGTHREQRSEISIRGHDDSILASSALEDHFVVGVLQSYRANVDSVMTGLL
jgi:hypothetical protein